MSTVHGILSSYFGDDEYDIGKSVRWLQYFCDTEYAADINLGTRSRQYMLEWNKSFPGVAFSYFSAFPFFRDKQSAAAWRRESFIKASSHWKYEDSDWVVFVDCSEGLCVDDSVSSSAGFVEIERTLEEDSPTNITDSTDMFGLNPYKAFIEYESAQAPSDEVLFLPVWAFVKDTAAYPVPIEIVPGLTVEQRRVLLDPQGVFSDDELVTMNTSTTTTSQSLYVHAGLSPRIFRASVLRDPGFDWEIIDTYYPNVGALPALPSGFSGSAPKATLSIVSYAYARWSEDPSGWSWDRSTTSEDSDRGFKMRKKISNVRPIAALPFEEWDDADDEDQFVWGYQPAPLQIGNAPEFSTQEAGGPEFNPLGFNGDFYRFVKEPIPEMEYDWPAGFPELTTPLYSTVFRQNPRDGLFYLGDEAGPVPWNYLTNSPMYSQEEWDAIVAQQVSSETV